MNDKPKFSTGPRAASGKKGIMLMNRIGSSSAQIFIANADGSEERRLFEGSTFAYHASISPDGAWVTFASERNGDGIADVWRCRSDGSGVEPVVATHSVEDALVLSPDGTNGAYVSTADGFRANICVVDLQTGARRNMTGAAELTGSADSSDGYFRPARSPDGEWLVFSSDRNTAWYGHRQGHGREHTQELGLSVIRADGRCSGKEQRHDHP